MDTGGEEQIDYGDEEYGGAQKLQYQGSGAIPALADEEMIGEDDDYEDLYDGVNVGEGFLQFHRSEAQVPPNSSVGNGGVQAQAFNAPQTRQDTSLSRTLGNSGAASDGRHHNASLAVKEPEMAPSNHISGALGPEKRIHDTTSRNVGFQGPALVAQNTAVNVPDVGKATNPVSGGPSGAAQGIASNQMAGNANASMDHMMINDNVIRPQMENGPTMLFVGELHWWTTDAEIESVLSHYGKVKEIKFFDERASGKSKGYCQVEFYDAVAAAACKEGMNGHIFNGRACVVAFASPQTLKQMGAAYASKNPQQPQSQPQGRRNATDGGGRGGGMNYPAGEGGRGFARGGWGRGQNAAARGPGGSGPRGRGPMGPKNAPGNVGGMGGGAMGNFGQGLGGPGFGGPSGGMMHPQAMMGPGFDPSYMGRGGGYGGFSGPGFPGMMPPFPGGNPMGMGGVAPHVNPAFFGRGMAPNGMGMMGSTGMEGHPGGMWADPGMGGWAGEEHGQKTRESSYGGEDGASDYGYGEGNPEKGPKTNAAPREKERPERDWSGNSERRYRDEREQDYDRSDRDRRYRDEKDGHRVHRQKERDVGYEDDWDRGQSSSRSRSRSRAMPEDDYRSRSRDVEYGKRRRAPSE